MAAARGTRKRYAASIEPYQSAIVSGQLFFSLQYAAGHSLVHMRKLELKHSSLSTSQNGNCLKPIPHLLSKIQEITLVIKLK